MHYDETLNHRTVIGYLEYSDFRGGENLTFQDPDCFEGQGLAAGVF